MPAKSNMQTMFKQAQNDARHLWNKTGDKSNDIYSSATENMQTMFEQAQTNARNLLDKTEAKSEDMLSLATQHISLKTAGVVTVIALIVVFLLMYLYNVLSNVESPTRFIGATNADANTKADANTNTTNHVNTTANESNIANTPVNPSEPTGANGPLIEKYSPYEDPTDSVNTYDNVSLFNNLNAVNAKLYVMDDCVHCTRQAELLGETKETLSNKINMVNCIQDGVFMDHCKNVDIKGFPTWECNGNIYTGAQSAQSLNDIVAQNQ